MADKQYVFVYGDPYDGFEYVGPLDHTDDTELESAFDNHTWWYIEMDSRATTLWRPGMPDPDEYDDLVGKLMDKLEAANDLFNDVLNCQTDDVSALLALRDIVQAWRDVPYDDD